MITCSDYVFTRICNAMALKDFGEDNAFIYVKYLRRSWKTTLSNKSMKFVTFIDRHNESNTFTINSDELNLVSLS